MAAAVPPNQNIVRGARPIGTKSGADWNGKLRRVCFLAAQGTATFIGDFVKLDANTNADGTVPAVIQAAAGDIMVGALVSLEPDTTNEGSLSASNYRRASTLRYGYVAWGDDVLYTMQEDSIGGSLATTAAGINVNIIVGAGDVNTGYSGMQIDSSTAAVTNTLHLRLHHVTPRVGNAIGDYAKWVVSINLDDDNAILGVS
jgi:hypothetical protein